MRYVVYTAVLLFLSPDVFAQSQEVAERWSVRAGVSHFDFDDWGAADPDGQAFQIYASYNFNEWLAAEIGWFDGERVTGEVREAPITIRPDERTVEPRALMFGPRLRWPLGAGWSVYGTFGYAYTSHFYRLVGGTLLTPPYTAGETRHDDEFFYGGGAGYALNDRWSVQFDYRALEFSELPLDSFGVTASYRFR